MEPMHEPRDISGSRRLQERNSVRTLHPDAADSGRPAVDTAAHPHRRRTAIVLISPYELGRQPFGLAEPARWLDDAGFDVRCCDLSIERLPDDALGAAAMVAIYLPMHTATRIAFEVLPKIRALAPDAVLCAYGLYAPVNARGLHRLGVDTVIGGEYEPYLLELAERVRAGTPQPALGVVDDIAKIAFRTPLRDALPDLERYAGLVMPDGTSRALGFAEASRGCKHLCRHCPVVPVYKGRFRIVPVDVVVADIAQQVAMGAEHISFGDPDFLNGPTHALRVARALHDAFPQLTWDATVKIEHIVRYPGHIETLAENGCLFLISAVESIDDAILARLAKGHTAQDFERAVAISRAAGLHLTPTFVPFTLWTTVEGYRALLERLIELRLVETVPAVQLSIRLLVPAGSYLFEIDGFADLVEPFDDDMLGHPWRHPDPAVDALQARIQAIAEAAAESDEPRRTTFERIWRCVHEALGDAAPALPGDVGAPAPMHSEPWYCCAEPTASQLAAV